MALARSESNEPLAWLASAAARLMFNSARIIANGMRAPVGKFCKERCVCAIHAASSGTFTSPIASVSIRYSCDIINLFSLIILEVYFLDNFNHFLLNLIFKI